MHISKKSAALRLLALVLVMALVLPQGAAAAVAETVQPLASDYIESYNGYVYPDGGGIVHVCFSVTGTGYMDEIGAQRITLYESTDNVNWTLKVTHTCISNMSLMGNSKFHHSGYITYQGVAGRYYKAFMGIYAGENGSGDSRYFWTSVKKAT